MKLALNAGQLFGQEICKHLSKKWTHGNTGEEVASLADMRLTVVTMITVVQREFHVTRERNDARAHDLIFNDAREGADVLALPNRIQ